MTMQTPMTPEQRIADALRLVTMRLERVLEEGRRSTRIDANDLHETLLSLADEIDPPVAEFGQEPD